MEEEEPEMSFPSSMGEGTRAGSGPFIEELDSVPDPSPISRDYDKAIVLFKPLNSPLFHSSPSNISLSVDSNFVSGFKGKPFSFVYWIWVGLKQKLQMGILVESNNDYSLS